MSSLKDKKSFRTDREEPSFLARPAEVVIGRIVSVTEDGAPVVDFPGRPGPAPLSALATARYDLVPAGAAVALMFLEGDCARPLAIGVVGEQSSEVLSPQPEESLTLTAAREIVLRCGRASLVLTRAGKVLVRGAYVSLRSSGMQRITGASVQIN
jgi:hypothetical protein